MIAERSKAAERQARYKARHPERVAAADRKWRQANLERRRSYNKQWWKENTEKSALYHKRTRANHPEREALRQKTWRGANVERVREYCRKRMALRRTATIGEVDIEKLIAEWDGNCGICKMPVSGPYHIDHIIPLTKGGPHTQSNLQVAHPSCNMSKGNKILMEAE